MRGLLLSKGSMCVHDSNRHPCSQVNTRVRQTKLKKRRSAQVSVIVSEAKFYICGTSHGHSQKMSVVRQVLVDWTCSSIAISFKASFKKVAIIFTAEAARPSSPQELDEDM